ncbi:MAG: chromosome segregation protein SMC, partial [Lachnospiraceae bacterium]|nr:chromosome segregation protein SMC [Lachnospiraceae bacterium]
KKLENEIIDIDSTLNEQKNKRQDLLILAEKKEGEIKLLTQQLENIGANSKRIFERIEEIKTGIDEKYSERAVFEKQKLSFAEKLGQCGERKQDAANKLDDIRKEIEALNRRVEEDNSEILRLANSDGHVKTSIEHADTVLEQNNIRHSELSRRLLVLKSDETETFTLVSDLEKKYDSISKSVEDKENEGNLLSEKLSEKDAQSKKLILSLDAKNQDYLGTRSRLEAIRQIAERYDGYSASVKKIMENRDQFPGICGVVADIISSDKKYETAVETALGASIQHIVTEDEKTAKDVIEYLKKEKAGRATFLPITSIGDGNRGKVDEEVFTEKGVIGDAASLANADKKYDGIVRHLLKNFVVVDHIDNALLIARKYDYNVRLVTLEGELLSPGGSIAGGAFKNKGNLLARKRELEELEKSVESKKQELDRLRKEQSQASEDKRCIREDIEHIREALKNLYVDQNTAKLELKRESGHLEEIRNKIADYKRESSELELKTKELKTELAVQKQSLSENERKTGELKKDIEDAGTAITDAKAKEEEAVSAVSDITVEYSNIEQALGYADENIARIDSDIERLKNDSERIKNGEDENRKEYESKNKQIELCSEEIENARSESEKLKELIDELTGKKEKINHDHKEFFNSWSELTKRINDLDKEVLRLQGMREKTGEIMDAATTYMWEEYQLTLSTAEKFFDPEFKAASARKSINECRQDIKKLGNVNVNAIEDYKNVSERYELLSGQRNDLTESMEKITAMITELDEAMRKQFAEQFELIKTEFNSVFRELFGGGKGELELIEDEDILTAGIRIIAQPPGKKLQNMMQLSGGEKALTAISLLFAIQNLKPSPFCLLDEIEAALDDSNVKRYASYLHKLTKNSQFIVITHRRGTMASADILYGITMQEKGVSTLVSVSLIEDDLDK